MPGILFVCLGNICRSPAGEGLLRHLLSEVGRSDVVVDSCGMGSWHIGGLPDERMRAAARRRGIELTHRAQLFRPEFFEKFDYILACDQEIYHELLQLAESTEHKAKIRLLSSFCTQFQEENIPDPLFEGEKTFDLVLDMLEDACKGVMDEIS